MAEDSDDGDPKVTVRVPEEDLEVIKAVAADEDHGYSQSHIMRYSLDRKYGDRDDIDWEKETTEDPVLDNVIQEYREQLDYEPETGVQLEPENKQEENQEEDLDDVSVMLDGDGEFEENSFEYAMTMYTLGVEKGDNQIQELSRQYLEENFPDKTFTKYLNGDF